MVFRARQTQLLTRIRAPIVLLGAMLLAIVLVSGLTLQLLSARRTQLDEALRESRARALDLLASRAEHALLGGLRPPFQVLSGFAAAGVEGERLGLIGGSFPEVQQIWLLDGAMRVRSGWSRARGERRQGLDPWLVRRLRPLIASSKAGSETLSTFVEKLDGEPTLFAVQPIQDRDGVRSWVLIQFDLGALRQRTLGTLFSDFVTARGGHIELQDPEAGWDDEALHEPLTHVLPGWLLSYWPNPGEENEARERDQRLLLAVSGGAVLALFVATYAAWRELRRERSLVDLRNRFVANVSHELKTPLALIRMYAETLYLGRVRDRQRRQSYYETILRESERLTEMINAVLDLERLRQGRPLYSLVATDLAATVRDVLERYRETMSLHRGPIEVDLVASLPPVAHDPQGVTQILLNLMTNAREHGGDGPISVRLTTEGDRVTLAVTDRGPAITKARLQQIRDALRRHKMAVSDRGSGLGLALVEQIAAAHHARLVLEKADEQGGLRAVVSFPTAASGRKT
jgi:signal transduction histidine kinase